MNKKISDNSPKAEATCDRGGAEGACDSGALAEDNAQLVIYLNSLLASAPQTKLDFSETGFNCDAADPFACGQGGAGEVLYFGAEHAKIRVKELRNENNLLKMKVARLIAQLNDAECKLDTACAENANLKSDIDDLQDRIVLYKVAVNDASRRVPENPAPPLVKESVLQVDYIRAVIVVEQAPVAVEPETDALEIVPALEIIPCAAAEEVDCETGGEVPIDPEITLDQGAMVADNREEQAALELPTPREDLCCVEIEPVMVPAVAKEEVGMRIAGDKAFSAPEPVMEWEREIAARGSAIDRGWGADARRGVVNETSSQKAGHDRRIFSNKVITADGSVQRIGSASRVIKREIKSQQPGQEKGRASNDAAPSSAKSIRETGLKPKPAFMPPVTAPETQSVGAETSKEVTLSTGVDEINVKAAPDTKTVARKHIERYRLIQKEADAPETATAPDLDGKA